MNFLQLEQDAEALTYQALNIKAKIAVVSMDGDQWQRGRVALAKVLRLADAALDITKIAFPNPQYSLSHCGSESIAICANSGGISGIGIDLERLLPSFKSRRNFLSREEENSIPQQKQEAALYLKKLWTIKEAAYKADPHNKGKTLKSYTVLNPGMGHGYIHTPRHSIAYCVIYSQPYSLAIAISSGLSTKGQANCI